MRDERGDTFRVDDQGFLVRRGVPRSGRTYEHRCPLSVYEATAHAIDEMAGPFNLGQLRNAVGDVPWSQVEVAYVFLKERGIVVKGPGRMHAKCGDGVHLDAMTEYHALREKGPEA